MINYSCVFSFDYQPTHQKEKMNYIKKVYDIYIYIYIYIKYKYIHTYNKHLYIHTHI